MVECIHKISMKKNIFLLLIVFNLACSHSTKFYNVEKGSKSLNEKEYLTLRNYLQKNVGYDLKDTLVIKYEFNNERCWDMLDYESDDYINGVILQQQSRIEKVSNSRKDLTILHYREPGKHFNKVVEWNRNIMIDTLKTLRTLLFHNNVICGCSAIIFPGGKYFILNSDPHFAMLDFPARR